MSVWMPKADGSAALTPESFSVRMLLNRKSLASPPPKRAGIPRPRKPSLPASIQMSRSISFCSMIVSCRGAITLLMNSWAEEPNSR
jgi:hypothetical protein